MAGEDLFVFAEQPANTKSNPGATPQTPTEDEGD
jgi:hypothetical protein